MMRVVLILLLLLSLSLLSFMPDDAATANNLSAVVIKLNYRSTGDRGMGGVLELRNIETGKVFKGESRMGFTQFVVVENIPAGIYKVRTLSVFSASNALTLNDEWEFNRITIDSPKAYYVGNYFTQKAGPLMKLNFVVTRTDNDDEKHIHKELKKRLNYKGSLSIDFGQHLFVSDTTRVSIQR